MTCLVPGPGSPNLPEVCGMLAASRRIPVALCTLALLAGSSLTTLPAAPPPSPDAVGTPTAPVDFERHIMGLFGRLGCNSGSCHGSFQGRGGFRLSLFGYDPEKDYTALTRDNFGRRINRVDPERSLLLLKPSGQVEHGGGLRFARDSWQYRLLRDWILNGASWKKGSGEVAAITVAPSELRFHQAGEAGRLTVTASFTDGSQEDITRFCDFRTNNDAVADVTASGEVKALRP